MERRHLCSIPAAAVVLLLSACDEGTNRADTPPIFPPYTDKNVTINPGTGQVSITVGSHLVALQPWSKGTIRVMKAAGTSIPAKTSLAVVATPDPRGWTMTQDPEKVTYKGAQLTAVVAKSTGLVSFFGMAGMPLTQEAHYDIDTPAAQPSRDGLKPSVTFTRATGERLYGGGVLGGTGDIAGSPGAKRVPDSTVDQLRALPTTIGMHQANAHIRIPVLQSSRAYGVFWDNPAQGTIALTASQTQWNSDAGDLVDYYLMAGQDPDASIAELRNLTGQAPMLPKWAYGFWYSKNALKSQDEIVGMSRQFRQRKFPVDAIVQDYVYWKPNGAPDNVNWGSHAFDPSRYPSPADMVNKDLHATNNMRFMVVVWPKFDPTAGANYDALDAVHGLFPPSDDFAGPRIRYYDPFSEPARLLYDRQVTDKLIKTVPSDAIWVDGAEPEMRDMGVWNRFTSVVGPVSRMTMAYALVHTDGLYKAWRGVEGNTKRVVLVPRSSWAGEQRSGSAPWTGDISHSWQTLAWQVEGLLNMTMAGLPYVQTDIGGYKVDEARRSDNTPELYVRWFQWGAFTPFMRTHGVDRKPPWLYGSTTDEKDANFSILKNYANLRYRLQPYIYTLASQVTNAAGTMMRPLMMDFRDDEAALDIWDQYMFGPAFMVAPVHAPGAKSRAVYLPNVKGGWYDFWTGAKVAGNKPSANALLNIMPLLVRAGSLLPMGPEQQYTGEKSSDVLELRIYRGADGAFSLYDDGGDGYDYENGQSSTIPITWDDAKSTLTIGDRKGSYPDMPQNRTFNIVLVDDQHGRGESPEANFDATVTYAGSAVSRKITPVTLPARSYEAEAPDNTSTGAVNAKVCVPCSGGTIMGNIDTRSSITFNGVSVPTTGTHTVQLRYENGDATTQTAMVSVNGGTGQALAMPPTGGTWANQVLGTVTFTAALNAGANNNTITLSNPAGFVPDIDQIIVQQ